MGVGRLGPGLEAASAGSRADLGTGGVTQLREPGLGLEAARVKLVESTEAAAGAEVGAKLNLESIESSNDWPSDMISMLAMSSVSGMLITLLVVESASSLTNLCGSDSAGSEVSIGSESGGGLGLGCGEVQLLLGSSASASGWSAAGLRRSPTELLLECVAVLHGVSFTSHDCSEAAARAARTLWYADRSDLLPWRSVM